MAVDQLFERPASMSNDIRSILDRLATVEGRLSPAQQKVPQLPALFKPKHIRALGSKTDPAHPMDGYMVGDSVQPRRTALEEAMAEIEEDMLSKVKRDLTTYLDKLEKKVRVDRDLKDKAVDAVQKGQAEEEIEEMEVDEAPLSQMRDYFSKDVDATKNPVKGPVVARITKQSEDTDPAAMHGPNDPGDTEVAHSAELNAADTLDAPQAPSATFEMADGKSLGCYGDDNSGYELRHGERALPSRFRSLDDAGMAVKLYQARQRAQQRDSNTDYIEER